MKTLLTLISLSLAATCFSKDFSWTQYNAFDPPVEDLSLNGQSIISGHISNYQDSMKLSTHVSLNGKTIALNDTGYFELRFHSKGLYTFKIESDDKQTIQLDTLEILPNHIYNGTFVLYPKSQGSHIISEPMMTYKPAIYLYPETVTEALVRLYPLGKIDFSYPEYDKGWKVMAHPDGTLEQGNKTYDYLFWDGPLDVAYPEEKFEEGWIVSKDSLVPFFERELTNMGLNHTERNDFITFWVPELMKNENTFIHFLMNEEYDEIAHLNVYPKVNNSLRMLMLYIDAKDYQGLPLPQKFKKFKRDGFTLVEWGGAKASILRKPVILEIPVIESNVDKPVIYLYPKTTKEFELQFDFKGDLKFTYPEYKDSWKGTMNPGGEILIQDQKFDYLFWEGQADLISGLDIHEGSIVEKDELEAFLETSLDQMGFNSREIQDFMCYWVPKMSKNDRNFIHFALNDAYDEKIAKMSISPKPDNMIRSFMVWGKVDHTPKMVFRPQKFKKIERSGFTLVEWGGSEIKDIEKRLPL